MSGIWVHGLGAVSPAGWGLGALCEAVSRGDALPGQALDRPGWSRPLNVRKVPAPAARPAFLAHPRLRRTSAISHYAVAAALEALGADAELVKTGQLRLGIILCVMSGCVNYSRRFYDEVLREPATASPLVFPETVFNAPASHLGALLGTTAIDYTLVGDPGSFPLGLVIAADWLSNGRVDGCVVIGAEELDWLTADAFRLFTRRMVISEGAGAFYLRAGRGGIGVKLGAVSEAWMFANRRERVDAIRSASAQARSWLGEGRGNLLCDGLQEVPWLDEPERAAWSGWSERRLSPRRVLGEGLMASAAWQCVVAADSVGAGGPGVTPGGAPASRGVAMVSGINEHVMWVGFERAATAT